MSVEVEDEQENIFIPLSPLLSNTLFLICPRVYFPFYSFSYWTILALVCDFVSYLEFGVF